jgi:hypothetical protein
LWSQGCPQQRCHSEYNVKTKIFTSLDWINNLLTELVRFGQIDVVPNIQKKSSIKYPTLRTSRPVNIVYLSQWIYVKHPKRLPKIHVQMMEIFIHIEPKFNRFVLGLSLLASQTFVFIRWILFELCCWQTDKHTHKQTQIQTNPGENIYTLLAEIIIMVSTFLQPTTIITIIPFVPLKGGGSSRHVTPLYSVVDFVQIHHSTIIPNTIHPSFSWSTPISCSWFLTLHCPSNKLFHFHSLHLSVLS